MATSFKKKSGTSRSRIVYPRGTKVSLHNNQLLISTGVPPFDRLIGGGIAVGTVLLIEEDLHGTYSNLLTKYFLAEGVLCKHDLFIASSDQNPSDLLKEIPAPILYVNEQQTQQQQQQKQQQQQQEKQMLSKEANNKNEDKDDELKIAWRYRHLPNNNKVQMNPSSAQFGHYYDLTETMEEHLLEDVKIHQFEVQEQLYDTQKSKRLETVCKELLTSIKETIDQRGFSTLDSKPDKNILRISVHSFGSPLWPACTTPGESNLVHCLCWFLMCLRSLMRSAFATCLVTIPTHLFEDDFFVRRLEYCSDTVIRLESFAGSEKEKNPLYKEYHGLFQIKKLPRINCLAGPEIDTSDLAFKLKRKKFSIEKLHLPPELSETANRSQSNPVKNVLQAGVPLCSVSSGAGKDALDF